jgi:amidophosphoribosyltransferase
VGGRRLQPGAAPPPAGSSRHRPRAVLDGRQLEFAKRAADHGDDGPGPIAIAHNGNLTNADTLRREMERDGAIFQSNSDTEVILHLLARAPAGPLEEQIAHALGQVQGAYSLLIMTLDALYAIRDPYGFRPLTLGRLGDAHVVASETCALDLMEAKAERDVEPGEILIISDAGTRSVRPFAPAERLHCVFEYVYFARPDSILWGRNVHTVRKALGRQLAREYPVGADIVIPVPDSGTSAALGYSEESGISYEMGLIRNHYVGRTFIEPKQGIRHFGVKVKLNPMREMLEGRRVVVVDDSIVRGTTSRKIVRMIRSAGAKEVHVRISSPPIQWPCYYGIDTPTRKELIGSSHSPEEIRRYLGADSLAICRSTACSRRPAPTRTVLPRVLHRELSRGHRARADAAAQPLRELT